MAVDNNPASPHYGRVYLAWSRRSCDDVIVKTYVAHHDVGQNGWSNPVDVTAPLGAQEKAKGAAIGVGGPGGIVYVALCWNPGSPTDPTRCGGHTTDQIVVTKSADGGASWTLPVSVSPSFTPTPASLPGQDFRLNSFPHINVLPRSGQDVALAYTGTTPLDDTSNVYLHSSDGGTEWSSPVYADPYTLGNQFFPSIGRSRDGSVMWMCFDDEGYSSTGEIDVSCVRSNDEATFEPPVRVTPSSFGTATAAFIGDYNNSTLVTAGGRYRVAWGGFQHCCPGANLDTYFAAQ
jgi:hypothetical protein